MTQFSWHWGCDNVGDGGSDSMTIDTMETIQRLLDNLRPTTDGVVYWTDATVLPFTGFVNASDGLLAPTNPSGNTVRIASGVGLVQGWLYANDDNVDFDVSSGPTTSTNYIVLRRDRSAQTVRLAYIVAAAPAGTAVVTQTAATWETIIATVVLDGSSNLSTLTDSRQLSHSPASGRVLIEEISLSSPQSSMVFSDIPPLFDDLELEVYALATAGAGGPIWEVMLDIDGSAGAGAARGNEALGSGASWTFNITTASGNPYRVGFCTDNTPTVRDATMTLVRIFDYARIKGANSIVNVNYRSSIVYDSTSANNRMLDGYAAFTLTAGDKVDQLTITLKDEGSANTTTFSGLLLSTSYVGAKLYGLKG